MFKRQFIWAIFNWKIVVQLPLLLFTGLALIVCLLLSNWQWQRAQLSDKQYQSFMMQNSRPDSALTNNPENYQKIKLSGQIKDIFFLDNQILQGIPGWHVLAEVETKYTTLLVNLGWQNKNNKQKLTNEIPRTIEVKGLIKAPQVGLQLKDAKADPAWPLVMQQVDIDLLNKELNKNLIPFVLHSEDRVGHIIPVPIKLENKFYMHLGYAFQWFLIGAVGLIIFIYLSRSEYKEYERKQKKLVA